MLVILSRFAVWDCFRRRFWSFVNHLNGQPVGPRFEQMVRKIQNWLSSSWNRVYYLYKSVPFAAKVPPRPEIGIKDGFSFGIFRPEQTGPSFQMFRCSRKFIRWKDPKKACSIFSLTRFSGIFL